MTQSVRVANAGLKVAVFSAICEGLVRVAGKGVREGQLTADGAQSTGEEKEKDDAETLRAQRIRRDERDAGRG